MTQTLARIPAEGNRVLDFALAVTFNTTGALFSGRADSPTYESQTEYKQDQLALTAVADDYGIPPPVIPLTHLDASAMAVIASALDACVTANQLTQEERDLAYSSLPAE